MADDNLSQDPNTPPQPLPPPAPPAGSQAPPPAAAAVVSGTKTEREFDLERQLEAERKRLRDVETRAAELEDQNRQLRQIGIRPPQPPKTDDPWTLLG